MDIRVPVSLKVNTETDFYQDFFLDLKEQRNLAGFIMQLLNAYYSNPEVRQAVDKELEITSPYAVLLDQLERIAIEHNKVTNATSAVSQQLDSITSQTKDLIGSSLETSHLPPKREDENVLESRIESIERVIPDIAEKLNLLINTLQVGGIPADNHVNHMSNRSQTITEETQEQLSVIPRNTENTSDQSGLIRPVNPLETEKHQNNEANNNSVNISLSDKEKELEIPLTTKTPSIIIVDDEEEATSTEGRPKRPASFGKARKSINKGE